MGGDGWGCGGCCGSGMIGAIVVVIESGGGWKWCRRLFDLDGDDEVDDGGGGLDEINISPGFFFIYFIKWNTV